MVCNQRSAPSKLGIRVAQPVGDHHSQRLLDRCSEAGAPEHGGEAVKAQLVPKLVKRPHVAQSQRRLEAQLRGCVGCDGPTLGAQQAVEQRVDLAAALVYATQRGDGALTGLAVFIAKRLHQLGVGVAAGTVSLMNMRHV